MKQVVGGMRSIKYGTLGALVVFLLFSSTAWAERFCIPSFSSCTAQNSYIDYNPRGGLTVPILSGGIVTNKPVDQTFSLILANGYGDMYFLNLVRDRDNYQAYRGYCRYRGFSLSGCSTTGEVVLLRIKETPSMPAHYSLVSTSVRWGNTTYILNDVFHPLNSTVYAGYENWYPFDMSCSVAMYVVQGSF